ncbi:serine/threonine-protein kinase [Spirillospora albida]|uniref:serine/threonine-protein kinase n=1 Tax=Spirillospora albida TaxID=58123 RepID=UPI000689CEC7|nr:serine/threonine-protein kinase [Spirillospora albida]
MDGDIRPLDPADPRMVGGHRLLGRLGSGGMGTVYLGADPVSGNRVAVKTIHPHLAGDPMYRQRFRDEAVLASRVASFCTARVLAHGEEDGRPYLVTEYVGGVSLRQRLAQDGPLPPAELHGVAVGVASALAAIHAAGLVHRDLKPANVMLTLSGCRVIDFGIARSLDSGGLTAVSGTVLGTPGWMAPELLRGGTATPAADVFAWGCLIANAGTGRMPFGHDPVTALMTSAEPDLRGVPDPIVPAVRAALSGEPSDRPSAADLLLGLVEQPGSGDETPAPPSGRTAGVEVATRAFTPIGMVGARSTTRVRVLAGSVTALGVALVGALLIGLLSDRSAPVTPRPAAPSASVTPTQGAAPAPVEAATSAAPTRPGKKKKRGKKKNRNRDRPRAADRG